MKRLPLDVTWQSGAATAPACVKAVSLDDRLQEVEANLINSALNAIENLVMYIEAIQARQPGRSLFSGV